MCVSDVVTTRICDCIGVLFLEAIYDLETCISLMVMLSCVTGIFLCLCGDVDCVLWVIDVFYKMIHTCLIEGEFHWILVR